MPHRGSHYRQVTTVQVEPGGALFFTDQFTCGRVAHGETWSWDRLCLEIDVRLGRELILRERFDQSGESLRNLAELAGSGPAACFANAVLIAPEAAAEAPWREAISALHGDGLWVGVSALRRGGWSLKFVAAATRCASRQALREARKILAAHFPRLTCDPRKL